MLARRSYGGQCNTVIFAELEKVAQGANGISDSSPATVLNLNVLDVEEKIIEIQPNIFEIIRGV